MNNQSDNAAAPSRTTVRVPTASGDDLEAWLYLREKVRRAMIDLLNQQLADVLDLGLQTKQAHWNVKGPHFGTTTRKAINTAAEAGDADTADLFTEVSRGVDKLLWLVEAHTQSKD